MCTPFSLPLAVLHQKVNANLNSIPVDACAPLQINKEVEAGIMGAGVLLLVGAGGALVVRDTLHLLQ